MSLNRKRSLNRGLIRIPWSRRTLFNQNDLVCLEPQAKPSRSGNLIIAGPTKPALVLNMSTIVNVITISHLTSKSNLNSLDRLALTRRTGNFSLFHIILPTVIGNMRPVLQAAIVGSILQVESNSLDSFGLTNGARNISALASRLPAVIRNMRSCQNIKRAS